MNKNALAFDAEATREMIAANFSAEMKRARWSGRSMAGALGLTQPYVARRASGEVELSGSDLALFSEFLNIPVSRFFVHPDTGGVTDISAAEGWAPSGSNRRPTD